jgi:hypothetical protein
MRQLLIVAITTALLASVSACAVRKVESSPPTVTYSYNSEDDYHNVATQADQYCRDRYDANAVLVSEDAEDGGYKALFACK